MMRELEYRWRPWARGPVPSVSMSGGPDRVVTNDPDPEFRRRSVGFVTPDPEPVETDEPLIWEGDDS